jgi:integrase
MALQAGVHPKVIQGHLGHSTIAITLDIYSHVIPAMQEEAAAMIARPVIAGSRCRVRRQPRLHRGWS